MLRIGPNLAGFGILGADLGAVTDTAPLALGALGTLTPLSLLNSLARPLASDLPLLSASVVRLNFLFKCSTFAAASLKPLSVVSENLLDSLTALLNSFLVLWTVVASLALPDSVFFKFSSVALVVFSTSFAKRV